jgi:hypothetical protein
MSGPSFAKWLAAVALALTLLPSVAPAKSHVAGCDQDVTAPIRQRNEALSENEAGDYVLARSSFGAAVAFRVSCTDKTTGRVRQWNLPYEAVNFYGISGAAVQTAAWNDDADDYRLKAQLANRTLIELLGTPTLYSGTACTDVLGPSARQLQLNPITGRTSGTFVSVPIRAFTSHHFVVDISNASTRAEFPQVCARI